MKGAIIASLCAAAVWLAVPASAHHSMAGFDRERTIELKGTIQQFKWANPHSWIEIEVPDASGKAVTWNVEMTAPAYLVRAGWKRTTLQPGDEVTIRANPLINGDPGAIFVSVELADGTVLGERAASPGKGKAKGKGK